MWVIVAKAWVGSVPMQYHNQGYFREEVQELAKHLSKPDSELSQEDILLRDRILYEYESVQGKSDFGKVMEKAGTILK